MMARSWKEAKEIAGHEGLEHVYHDYDNDTYGACRAADRQGAFSCGIFSEHRCIHLPASLSPEEIEKKEKKFLEDNPEWLKR
ncbi:MAG: hypothetical protein PWP08_1727 [Methanofollis sp.]|nr:hypothetical protein [Methanofollis sp.]